MNMRPYYGEGSKTVAYEIAEQLGWRTPDRCVVPVASGSLFTKIAKGFAEWQELGLIDGDAPTMKRRTGAGLLTGRAGVRVRHRRLPAGQARHHRKSLAIGNPADGPYAVELARTTGGAVDSVTDDEIP